MPIYMQHVKSLASTMLPGVPYIDDNDAEAG